MNLPLHDTHFHLDLFERPGRVLQQIEQAKVYTMAVTNVPEVFMHTYNLVKDSKYTRAGLGLHPELAFEHHHQLSLFQELLHHTRYIGEVGLDNYNKSPANFGLQKQAFEKILSACDAAGGKILTIHSRKAESEVIDMIGTRFSGKLILHWFSGPLKELDRAVSRDFYFSVNFAMTQSENGRKIIERIPHDKLLLETDGPFVKVKSVPATPETVRQTVENLLLIKDSTLPPLSEADICRNFQALIAR